MPKFEIAAQTFKQLPTGGVQAPTANPETKTMPKCTGDTPISVSAGRKTGVSSKIAGLTSMNVPAARMIKSTTNNVASGDNSSPATNAATASGTRSSASTQM